MASYEKPDFWSLKAQKEGYPARSVYKLIEIDGKFGLLGKASQGRPRILDLGAAPGSWSLYILRRFKPHVSTDAGEPPLLTAVDIQNLSRRFDKGLFDRKDFFFIRGDFGSAEVRDIVSGRGPYTVLLSDAAPATTGNRTVDTQRSLALAEQVLAYADSVLAPGGNLAMKVFQGSGAEDLPARLRERFTGVRSFKPKTCRSDSFETYFLGLGKKEHS
ncbi:MAG: RlmE family RNA methyltransferase [Treponema sp.]|jgi:23S rRNA (uridine2552-2'-O)-methyltransferase|nr:RlmE family RNA methyltransferase [Treponema sp.]